MDLRHTIKDVLENLKKEQVSITFEEKYVAELRNSAERAIKDNRKSGLEMHHIKAFEKMASRSEQRIHQFESRILEELNYLRQRFPKWSETLSIFEQKFILYEKNILKRVSYIDGTLPNLIKNNDLKSIVSECEAAINQGTNPLRNLLGHIESEIRKNLSKGEVSSEIKVEQVSNKPTENYLNRNPFLVIFHSANEKAFAHNLLMIGRQGIPNSCLGRKLEYAMEVDYFWIEHNGRLSTFFGHTLSHFIPKKAAKIMEMYRGKTDPTKLKHRMGLMHPPWLLSRIGRIKLAIEIKGGRGSDKKALDHLVKLIRLYHLERNIIFLGFSAWPLEYLKRNLPHSFVIHMAFADIPIIGRNLPVNKFFRSLKFFGPFNKYRFVNAFSEPSKNDIAKDLSKINNAAKKGKYYVSWKVDTIEQFGRLVKHGGRGGIMFAWPEEVMRWISDHSFQK
jgi:hypothetical protein